MTTQRKVEPILIPAAAVPERPLSARSVIVSTLLGAGDAPLPGRLLVRAAGLFGVSEGTARVALSRLVAAGELDADDGHYRLAGPMLERQARQGASRRAEQRRWNGRWSVAVVGGPARRPAADRAALRDAMHRLKLAELREGVWLRPDNLDPGRSPGATEVVAAQCLSFTADTVDGPPFGPTDVPVGELWDLNRWASTTERLRDAMADVQPVLDAGDEAVLAPGWVLSAAVLRHFLADPELPDDLLPADWPGTALRADYDRYDRAFQRAWRDWFRSQA